MTDFLSAKDIEACICMKQKTDWCQIKFIEIGQKGNKTTIRSICPSYDQTVQYLVNFVLK